MRGLLLKDFYVLGKQLKWFLFVTPLMVAFMGEMFLSVVILLFSVLPMTAIAYDEQAKWNNLAVMMPYSKKDLVISKYLLGYLGIVCIVIIAIVVLGVMGLTGLVTFDFNVYKPIILMGVSGALILLAFNIFIAYKYGVEKGRYAFMGLMFSIGAVTALIKDINNDLYLAIQNISASNLFIIAIVLNIVSIVVAYNTKGDK